MSKNNYEGIHAFLVNQVRYHARSLMRHSAIHGVEVEDLEQELMLDYLSRKQAYDPEKAKWSTCAHICIFHFLCGIHFKQLSEFPGPPLITPVIPPIIPPNQSYLGQPQKFFKNIDEFFWKNSLHIIICFL